MDEVDNGIGMVIVKFCMLLIIGLVILSSVVLDSAYKVNQVDLSFSNQPSDGDILTLDNHIFEFDSVGGVVDGHIAVTIGADANATKNNLIIAVRQNTSYEVY